MERLYEFFQPVLIKALFLLLRFRIKIKALKITFENWKVNKMLKV
jgi:hypothetical protein